MPRIRRRALPQTAGGGGPLAAPFPSRWAVSNHHFVDENGVDLGIPKGFNWNCVGSGLPFANSVFAETKTLIDTAAVPGPPLLRKVFHWDLLQPSAGAFAGIASPTATATAGSAFNQLDVSIQRAYDNGCYCYLDLHLMDAGWSTGGGVLGRVPVWAQTGSSPAGIGNAWTWYITNGQAITQCLAQRYGDPATSPIGAAAKAVVGFSPNEPPTVSIPAIQTGFASIVAWWQAYAPLWPVWISPSPYGGGTPYPSGATAINVASLLALDTQGRGIAIDWHTYLSVTGTASSDGYQANGTIDPLEQVSGGSQYHGWTGGYDYPNTSGSRADIAAHMAPLVTLRDEDPSIAICLIEFGMDHQEVGSNHDEWILDTINAARAAGMTAEVWWQKGFGGTNFDSQNVSGSTYRTGISGASWMGNATARASGGGPPGPTTPPTVIGTGALGETPDTATAAMTATGATLHASTASGDLLVGFAYFDTGAAVSGLSVTAPAGWAQLIDTNSWANGNIMRVYVKAAGPGEGAPASPTFNGGTTGASGATGLWRVVTVRGADVTSLPSSAHAGVSSGNSFSGLQNVGVINGFTPTEPDTLVVVFAGKKATFTSVDALSGDGLTWTELFEAPSTRSDDASMVASCAAISGAAVTISGKTFTVTGGSAANSLGVMFAIAPS